MLNAESQYTINEGERICMPTTLYRLYEDSIGEWVDVTTVDQCWRVLINIITGKEIDCNNHYADCMSRCEGSDL